MRQPINTNAEFCGKVPLHQTNLIQPHGFLLIVDRAGLRIVQASENIAALLGREAKQVVTTALGDYIPEEGAARIRARFEGPVQGRLPFILTFPGGVHLATIKGEEAYLILEVEAEPHGNGGEESFISIYQDLRYAMAAIEQAATTEEACAVAVTELKRISGFDKIMVYRFDEGWNGDVIAEVMEEGMDSYLGLKFPASDVPKQARELYRKTPYRLIPNTEYEAVRLYPVLNPLTNAFTDLSDSNLRSVAAVHLEYLRNMQVTASMSTRILKNDQLWGLIACHHRAPKYLSFEQCAVFELLSNVISARIAAVQNADSFRFRTGGQQLLAQLMEQVYREKELITSFYRHDAVLLDLLHAEGVAVVLDRKVETFGNVPDTTAIEDLVVWLQSHQVNRLYHQPALSSVFEPAESYADRGSGILALPVQVDKGNFILAFRPEAVRKVNWGGNPNEAIHFEPDGKRYHPRASFHLWQQTVHHTALPWKEEELEIAEQFRNFVVEFTLNNL